MRTATSFIAAVVVLLGVVGQPAAAGPTYAQLPVEPVAHWKFDGNLLDSSGSGNHLSLDTGTVTYVSPIAPSGFGTGAFDFDGATRLVNTSTTGLDFTTAYTVAGWMQAPLPGGSGYYGIFNRTPDGGGTSDIELYVQAATNDWIVFHNRGNGGPADFVGNTDPPNDSAFHFAVTYDRTDVLTYYDGVLQSVVQGATAVAAPLSDSSPDVFVGAMHPTWPTLLPSALDGILDELMLFDEALTPEQIDFIQNNPISGTQLVPEPSTLALSALALLPVGFAGWRRRRR